MDLSENVGRIAVAEYGVSPASSEVRRRFNQWWMATPTSVDYSLRARTPVLQRDLPEHALAAGDLGAIVGLDGDTAADVEFVRASGRTQTLVELAVSDLNALSKTPTFLKRPAPPR